MRWRDTATNNNYYRLVCARVCNDLNEVKGRVRFRKFYTFFYISYTSNDTKTMGVYKCTGRN